MYRVRHINNYIRHKNVLGGKNKKEMKEKNFLIVQCGGFSYILICDPLNT